MVDPGNQIVHPGTEGVSRQGGRVLRLAGNSVRGGTAALKVGFLPWMAVSACLLAIVAAGCQRDSGSAGRVAAGSRDGHGRVDVWCTAWPLWQMTSELVSDGLSAGWMCPEGGFPEGSHGTWTPSEQQYPMLQSAQLLVDNGPGASYVAWPGLMSQPAGWYCDSTVDFRLADFIPVPEMQISHSHGPEGEHSHDYMVPFVWHDPVLASRQARTIAAALRKKWPDQASAIDQRLDRLTSALEGKAAADLRAAGEELQRTWRVVLASPDLLFLARALGWEKPDWRLWNLRAATSVWKQNFADLVTETDAEPRLLVLFPGEVPAQARQAAPAEVRLVGIDMLEFDRAGTTVASRLAEIAGQLREIAAQPPG